MQYVSVWLEDLLYRLFPFHIGVLVDFVDPKWGYSSLLSVWIQEGDFTDLEALTSCGSVI